ncbi:MAG: tRNA (guanine(10)-N(2))-dimethyltransferase [Candidatus Hydrothermarchaeales archaeon]
MHTEIVEGTTKLLVPKSGDASKKQVVFYNPRSKLSRDVSCSVIKALAREKDILYLDLLAASGARGIRVANEAGVSVHLNDASAEAYENILRNAELNDVEVEVSNEPADLFLRRNSRAFNFIDIDPFGSPAFFLDNAVATLKRNGYLAFAATDTAALCGVYPKTCLRRYSSLPIRCEFAHEVGLRILLGYTARICARYGKGMNCLLSHSTEHYFRTYIELPKGKKEADLTLEQMGYLYYCRACLNRSFERQLFSMPKECKCGHEYEVAGPLWLGSIKDSEFCRRVLSESRYLWDAELEKLLETITQEVDIPFYYDIHTLCSKLKVSAPPMEKIIRGLRGYKTSRTHFSPTCIKTEAGVEKLKSILLPLLFFLAVFAEHLYRVSTVIAK